MTVPAAFGFAKAVSPWVGIVAIAFYVGSDRATIDSKMAALAHADTTNMVVIHGALHDLSVKVDSVAAGQRQLTCYILNNRSPECRR